MRNAYSYKELVESIEQVGIGRGDLVHVHSALFAIGQMQGVSLRDIPLYVCKAFREVIGSEGTLSVAAAFEDYARFGSAYDCRLSPVDQSQGALGQYIAQLPDAFRTYCPMSAIAAIGPLAEEVAHSWTGSAYGTDSGWEKLWLHDAKLCFLGVRPHLALNYVYLIQFRFGVPHLYNKLYTVPIYENGHPISLPVTCTVRYLDRAYRISESAEAFEKSLFDQGSINMVEIGRGRIYNIMSARMVFNEGTKKLKKDLYYFLKWPPQFVDGKVPTDGCTGALVPDRIRFTSKEESIL